MLVLVAKATYNVLMGVHEDVEAILFCLSQQCYCMVYPLFVVLSGPSMFYRLPREDVSYCVVAPAPQPGEVCAGILERERPIDKRDIVTV